MLAAANPLYGRYNTRRSISENVNLPNSLLSRFDLLFLIIDRTDVNLDIALSKHVLHVHRYLRNPDSVSTSLPIAKMKVYIAEARKIVPVIPRELSSYIVEAYVNLRSQKDSHSRGNDQTVLTPRQLLSILRISQALARLRMSRLVSQQDVDEAIRLTHSSKSSLNADDTSRQAEDPTSTIFNMIREAVLRKNSKVIPYTELELMIVKKGFTSKQFERVLDEYSSLQVILVDADRTKIELLQ